MFFFDLAILSVPPILIARFLFGEKMAKRVLFTILALIYFVFAVGFAIAVAWIFQPEDWLRLYQPRIPLFYLFNELNVWQWDHHSMLGWHILPIYLIPLDLVINIVEFSVRNGCVVFWIFEGLALYSIGLWAHDKF